MEAKLSTPLGQYVPYLHRDGRRRRILVVDDNTDGAESMAILLRLLGYEADTAYNGPAAIQAAQVRRPDVVLLDITMPGITGYEVARQLRNMFKNKIAIIAVTARSSEEDRRRSREAGFDRHLVKPTDLEELEGALRQLACVP